MSFINLPYQSRLRHNRRTDSRADSGANTPGNIKYFLMLVNILCLYGYIEGWYAIGKCIFLIKPNCNLKGKLFFAITSTVLM